MGSTACILNQVYIYEKLGFSIIYPLFGNYVSAVPKLNNKPLLGGFYVVQKTFLESVYFTFAPEVSRSLGSGTRVPNFVSTHFRHQWPMISYFPLMVIFMARFTVKIQHCKSSIINTEDVSESSNVYTNRAASKFDIANQASFT